MNDKHLARVHRLRRFEGQELDGGRFRIGRLVGAGATGGVYRGSQRGLPRPVAIKVVRTTSRARRRRFLREVVAMSAVSHPNLPTILDVGSLDESRAYVVMEWVSGRSCSRLVANSGPMEPSDALRVVSQVVASLVSLHAAGVVHRDVKPSNVLVDVSQRTLPCKLVDLGVARLPCGGSVSLAPMTLPGRAIGTPGFMAPEQAAGGCVDARADLWSAGVLLRWLCTGSREGRSDDRLPEAVADVVRLATRLLPDGRPASANELLELLENAAQQLRQDSPHSASTVILSRRHIALEPTCMLR